MRELSLEETVNSERLSTQFLIFVFNLSSLIHLHPQIRTFGNVHFPSSRNVWRGLSAEVCAQPTRLLKLETPLLCRHADTEPLPFTSDPYINMSFQASSEETTLKPQHLFPHRCIFIPHKLPFFVPQPFLKPCKKLQELNLTP